MVVLADVLRNQFLVPLKPSRLCTESDRGERFRGSCFPRGSVGHAARPTTLAGGGEQRAFPWGSTPLGSASEYAIYNCNYPSPGGSCSGLANIAPVGTAARGAGRWGQLDLVGELNEWNLDWYAPYVSPCADCAYLADGSGRVDRAGYFVSAAAELAPSYRNSFYPTNRSYNYGFRCARTP